MKVSPIVYVVITTVLLVTVTVMSAMNFPFNWVFYVTVFGQAFVIVMVYKVLTDQYTTDKTFEHFYEDCPIPVEVKDEENYR